MARFEFNEKGIDKLQKHLKKLSKVVDRSYSFSEMFPDSFMQMHTKHNSMSDFLDNSGFPHATQEEFNTIPDEAFDQYVKENSNFNNWKEMMDTAVSELIKRKMK